jgi:hypothetical protein
MPKCSNFFFIDKKKGKSLQEPDAHFSIGDNEWCRIDAGFCP